MTIAVRSLSTGRVRPKRDNSGLRRYLPGAWSDRTLPVHVFVIGHPEGVCVFDTGQTARAVSRGYFPRWYPFFRLARFELGPEDEAAAQLAALGHDPASVRWVVLSHMHTDHVGGLDRLGGAEVLVARVEWERARGIGGRLRGYLPQYWPAGVRPSLIEFTDGPIGPFASSHDLAGDGRLVLVPTPGHTPGHMGLLVRTEERTYLCGGDAANSLQSLELVAPAVADYCRQEGIVFLATHDCRVPALLGPQ